MAKNDFQYGGWNSCTLQCGMRLWKRDSEFTKWQHQWRHKSTGGPLGYIKTGGPPRSNRLN